MATSNLNYVHSVIFDHVPLAWTTRFEFFTPDLEQFPLMYVHKYIDVETRVYGFPVSASVSKIKGKECNIIVTFLCNHPPGNKKIDEIIVNELSHRFGLANMVSLADIPSICKGNQTYQHMLTDLWNGRIDKVYGGKIPHGRIYDEVFGIVRFSASGVAPRLGKTSELRMTYWFLKEIGEKVTIGNNSWEIEKISSLL